MPRIRLLCHKLSICLKFIGNWEAVFQSSWTIYTLTSNEPCFISSSAFGTVSFVSLDRQRGGDFFGRNDAKAEAPVFWPPHAKSWLIGKDSDAGRDSGQEEKGTTEDEMAGWYHGLDGCESEWTPGDGDGQEGLACCYSWGCKESDRIERLNWTVFIPYIKS